MVRRAALLAAAAGAMAYRKKQLSTNERRFAHPPAASPDAMRSA